MVHERIHLEDTDVASSITRTILLVKMILN